MKHMQTPSHTFIAVKFDTTGNVERNPLDVVKKLSIVVTPEMFLINKNNKLNIIYFESTFRYFNKTNQFERRNSGKDKKF